MAEDGGEKGEGGVKRENEEKENEENEEEKVIALSQWKGSDEGESCDEDRIDEEGGAGEGVGEEREMVDHTGCYTTYNSHSTADQVVSWFNESRVDLEIGRDAVPVVLPPLP